MPRPPIDPRPRALRGPPAPTPACRFVAACVAALASGACGESGPGSRGGPAAPADVLVAALDADPGHLNPAITTGGGIHTAAELIYNGLVELGPDLEPVPGLAERWDVEDGGRLYRFHLRRGVRWHDGEAFDADDVAWTFREALLRYHARTRASLGTALDSLVVEDAHTVAFHFSEPYAPLLAQLHVHEAPILPAHLYEGTDPLGEPPQRGPRGDRDLPFPGLPERLGDPSGGQPPLLPRGAAAPAGLVYRVVPDPGTRLLALETGEVDWLYVSIARALAPEPDVLVLDEPVSGLDRRARDGVLALLASLQRERGLAYLLVSHDLSVVRGVAHRVAVMWRGRVVEEGPAGRVLSEPEHPHTRALVAAIPRGDGRLLEQSGALG